jgi:Dual-action HEIGH metallo-peptidase
MVFVRSLLRRLRRVRPRHAVLLLAVLGLGLGALGRSELPVLAAGAPEPWPQGRVTYFDASGSGAAIDAAAVRWNRSGARVRIVRAPDRRRADVVFVVDAEALRSDCGQSCLALASSIGRPGDGRATVRLSPAIAGAPTPLGVWVAMHELGHVLGLRHRDGGCSLMNAHAYDDGCSFVGGTAWDGPLPCGPASDDVAEAARLYGRDAGARPCR